MTDANPNKIIQNFLKQSKDYLSRDNLKITKVYTIPAENYEDYRFDDRRIYSRINSGRRQMDLISYY